MFCSVEYPDLLLKRKLKTKGPPEVQPEDFWQQTPNLGWEEVASPGALLGHFPVPSC